MTVGKAKGYGCYNRKEYHTNKVIQDGWNEDGTRAVVTFPFRMTRDCQYTHTELGQQDSRCDGCKWRKN